MAIEGSSIRLYFSHAETGLAFKTTGTGFEIAGADGTYVTATATIQDDGTVLVSAASVTAPKNARYCWAGNPTASLYNKGTPALPASPFRTDAPALPAGGPDGGVVGPTDSGAVVGPKDAGVVTGDAPSVGPKDAGVVTGDAPSVGPKDSGVVTTGGSGGNTGTGGITGSGGVTGAGGSTRSGGNTAAGGNTVAGGNTTPSSNTAAAGGNTVAGGIIASGGIIVSGGNTAPGSNASGGNTGADTAQATGATKESGCSCRLASRPGGLSDTAACALGLLLVLGARRNRRRSRLDRH
jgi:hypothetical protein